VNVCRAYPKVAVLTSPGAGPAELALLLDGVHRTFVICEELGTEREQVTVLTSDKVADHTWRDPNVVIVIGGSPAASVSASGALTRAASAAGSSSGSRSGPGAGGGWVAGRDPGYPHALRGWALAPDAAAGRPAGEGESVQLRAAQLARLGPRLGDLVWDIGCGGGELAADAARFGAAVIAVDDDPAACLRADAAFRRHGVQAQIVRGRAPHVLERLAEPDVVRIGGGGVPVVIACADRRPERIVTHASTRDEAEAIGSALADGGYTVECALLQSVELDTRDWSERERSVVFLLAGRLERREGGSPRG
jgi:precorrin-6Y C5,15-methyltransferase (decarboxylating)